MGSSKNDVTATEKKGVKNYVTAVLKSVVKSVANVFFTLQKWVLKTLIRKRNTISQIQQKSRLKTLSYFLRIMSLSKAWKYEIRFITIWRHLYRSIIGVERRSRRYILISKKFSGNN